MSSLQATPKQIQRIRQARIEIGWPIEDPQWLVAASKILEPDPKWDETIKLKVSIGTWKRFLARKPIRPTPYKAFCQILDIPWQETIAAQRTTTNHVGNIINLLLALNIDLTGYDFSHLTIRQAYLQQEQLPQVNFTRCHFSQTIFSQDLGSIFTVTFSLDQNILVTGGMDGKVRIWQVADGKQIHAWQAHDDWIRHVTFSPDGQLIASCSNDRSVKIWKIPHGEISQREIPDWENIHCLYNLQGHTD